MKRYFLWCCVVIATQSWASARPDAFVQSLEPIAGTQTPGQCCDYQSIPDHSVSDSSSIPTNLLHEGSQGLRLTFNSAQAPDDAYMEAQSRLQLAAARNTDYQALFDRLEQPVEAPVTTQAPGECGDFDPENQNLYFGDLHVHTNFSMDAFSFGTRYDPAGAYANVQGRVDFVAVTDHVEYLGETLICKTPFLPGYRLPVCWQLRNGFVNPSGLADLCKGDSPSLSPTLCDKAEKYVWQQIQAAAHQAYDPCKFTTFVGYEYTLTLENQETIHRNAIFDGENIPEPINSLEQPTPDGLWQDLMATCLAEEDCQAITIPHSPNSSKGEMFSPLDLSGNPISPEEAQRRAKYETVVEMFQHKGNSECYPNVGNNDPDCAFEQLDMGPITSPDSNEVPSLSFVRNGLKEGLRLRMERPELGINPFRFGFIGSTDTHNATPGKTDEIPYVGNAGIYDDTAEERLSTDTFLSYNPGGLAAVWAPENTRGAIFAALQRRETYATSGTRIAVRFFGGWKDSDWPPPGDICDPGNISALPKLGYDNGVPMGGILTPLPSGDVKPVFVVHAEQDPVGTALLQKIQIIKGSYRTDLGALDEKVITPEVLPPPGETLCIVWTDEDFRAEDPSFYYARVFEQETKRWSWHDCQDNNIDCTDPDTVPADFRACCDDPYATAPIQERAWTSPIWYEP